jgi:hypothetical protein
MRKHESILGLQTGEVDDVDGFAVVVNDVDDEGEQNKDDEIELGLSASQSNKRRTKMIDSAEFLEKIRRIDDDDEIKEREIKEIERGEKEHRREKEETKKISAMNENGSTSTSVVESALLCWIDEVGDALVDSIVSYSFLSLHFFFSISFFFFFCASFFLSFLLFF